MSVSSNFRPRLKPSKTTTKAMFARVQTPATLITMSNSRYTLQVETDDDNLMFFWRTHLNHNLPFTAYNVYEYYHSRSGIDALLRECRESLRRVEDTQMERYDEICGRVSETETIVARALDRFLESRGKLSRRITGSAEWASGCSRSQRS